MGTLLDKINEIEANIQNFQVSEPEISKASVGWHLEHMLLVINQVFDQLEKSDTSKFKKSFNFNRLLVFILKKIPRGRGKAPKPVIPKGDITEVKIREALEIAKRNVSRVEKLEKNRFFYHLYFGNLDLKDTIHFLNIHTQHHLDIVRDIMKKSK